MDKKEEQQHAEMVAFVKKHHKVIEDDLRESDKNNFITKVTINYSTVEHNPMGGANASGYINGDKTLIFHIGLDIVTIDGKTKVGSCGLGASSKLTHFLGDE